MVFDVVSTDGQGRPLTNNRLAQGGDAGGYYLDPQAVL